MSVRCDVLAVYGFVVRDPEACRWLADEGVERWPDLVHQLEPLGALPDTVVGPAELLTLDAGLQSVDRLQHLLTRRWEAQVGRAIRLLERDLPVQDGRRLWLLTVYQ